MPNAYGEDKDGKFVLWENKDGQSNKKYIDGPNKGEHQGYDPENQRSFVRSSKRDWEDGEEQSSSGICFIASAVLGEDLPLSFLRPLKKWRYSVMEKSFLGEILSDWYRRTGVTVAEVIAKHPRVRRLLFLLFVRPGVKLSGRSPSAIRDIFLYLIFLLGWLVAKAISLMG
ncbi:hypothetical protein COT51_03835 [candidate division WWE3 bacterium CG08_land_8_20_14_0_20_41_15]|uniref:Uncharacterized protein n=1 Tax=candidate division WWE3 bacterium CG08_land_8_20_14_0_20_41_15 TaxID=1975086 RepID=A0A2H0X8J8_UNCKA|nr:MAG: hypothetical protein COT51_03835 [candidate division WWE3 bacterium CG08_land_8_20_14_0_20_41_15]